MLEVIFRGNRWCTKLIPIALSVFTPNCYTLSLGYQEYVLMRRGEIQAFALTRRYINGEMCINAVPWKLPSCIAGLASGQDKSAIVAIIDLVRFNWHLVALAIN